jgi:hypothetical protein
MNSESRSQSVNPLAAIDNTKKQHTKKQYNSLFFLPLLLHVRLVVLVRIIRFPFAKIIKYAATTTHMKGKMC